MSESIRKRRVDRQKSATIAVSVASGVGVFVLAATLGPRLFERAETSNDRRSSTVGSVMEAEAPHSSWLAFAALTEECEFSVHESERVLALIAVFRPGDDDRVSAGSESSVRSGFGLVTREGPNSTIALEWGGTKYELGVDAKGQLTGAEALSEVAAYHSEGRYFLFVGADAHLELTREEQRLAFDGLVTNLSARTADARSGLAVMLEAEKRH
jgi:hypothetical protein